MDVARDLQRTPRQIQARYLYDPLGSSLFDAICRLPWYRITRAEARLLARHAGEIARAALDHGADPSIIELGCGNGEKLETIVRAFPAGRVAAVHLIDISAAALAATSARLARIPKIRVRRHEGTYEQGLEQVHGSMNPATVSLVLFLGSNIGNFDKVEAHALMRQIRDAIGEGALLLLGTDLVKPAGDLQLAYDDPLGVTAAFNKNLLVRINRELGASFDLAAFDHLALWNEAELRVEMHLVSRKAQEVEIPAAGVRIAFAAGETIWTESSYKYTEAGISDLARATGFAAVSQWIDDEARFAVTLLEAT